MHKQRIYIDTSVIEGSFDMELNVLQHIWLLNKHLLFCNKKIIEVCICYLLQLESKLNQKI